MNEASFIKELTKLKTREKAFAKLLDLYQERLYWQIRKIVTTHENANDVLQNTFLKVYKNLPNFKQQSSLHTWMFRIAYNESVRFLEVQKRKATATIDDVNEKYLSNLYEDDFFNGNEAQIKLQNVLSLLPEKQRHIFQMKYYDDLKFREIASILKIAEGTIKTHYYGAVKFIEENIMNVSFNKK